MTKILMVCTGNVCRSPAGELLMQEYLGNVAHTRSAGTRAMVGHGIPDPMRELLAADGLDGSAHTARQLTPAISRHADIIIAMSAADRATLVRDETSAIPKAFLLTELATAARESAPLAGATRKERVANIPASIIAFRPELSGLVTGDVPDPYGRDSEDYRKVYVIIKEAVLAIDRWVTQGT